MSFNGELLEIFSWLPASILFKFSAVSKSSKKLLSEAFFVRKQCKNMQHVPDSEFFIQPDCFQQHSSQMLEMHTLTSTRDANRIPKESLEFLAKQGPIIASSNGLVCSRNVQLEDNPLFLFNPVTKNYLQIPFPCDSIKSLAEINVIMDCNTYTTDEGYFLMVLVPPPEFSSRLVSLKIYSPEANIWCDGGEVDLGQRSMKFQYSVKANEIIYMISDNGHYLTKNSPFYWPYIAAYGIKNSSCTFLSLPEQAREGLLDDSTIVKIFKWADLKSMSGSICLVKLSDHEVFTVWVLSREDDSTTVHWTCILNKDLVSGDEEVVAGFTVINGHVLLFATVGRVCSYDLRHGNNGETLQVCEHKCGDRVELRSYSSTLRPCALTTGSRKIKFAQHH